MGYLRSIRDHIPENAILINHCRLPA
jgi:H2-forming N5,N10-methylenetetrahydromethanopterin dehydrogenase-like enzyme